MSECSLACIQRTSQMHRFRSWRLFLSLMNYMLVKFAHYVSQPYKSSCPILSSPVPPTSKDSPNHLIQSKLREWRLAHCSAKLSNWKRVDILPIQETIVPQLAVVPPGSELGQRLDGCSTQELVVCWVTCHHAPCCLIFPKKMIMHVD